MKLTHTTVAALAVLLTLAACGGRASSSTETTSTSGDESSRDVAGTDTNTRSPTSEGDSSDGNDLAPAGPRTIELPGAHTLDSVRGITLATLDYGETQLDSRYLVSLAPDRVGVQIPWQMAGVLTASFADGTSVEVRVRPLGHVRRYCNAIVGLASELPESITRLGYGRPELSIVGDPRETESEEEDESVPPMRFVTTRPRGGLLMVQVIPTDSGIDIRAHVEPIASEDEGEIATFFEDVESHIQLELCGQ